MAEAAGKRVVILSTQLPARLYKNIPKICTYEKFREYFDDQWAAVSRGPLKFEGDQQVWQSLLLLCVRSDSKCLEKLAYVRVSSIFEEVTDVERAGFMSYITYRWKELGKKFGIPSRYLRYNVLAGADHRNTKEEALKLKKKNDFSRFFEGQYYFDIRGFKAQRYSP